MSARRFRIPAAAWWLLGVAALAVLPLLNRSVGSLLPGPLNSVGTLEFLAVLLVTAAVAVTLDVMVGYTGLITLGHALYFGLGCYAVVMLSEHMGLGRAAVLATGLVLVCSLLGNAAALAIDGFGFTLATLALSQLMVIAVERGYAGTGGEVGLPLNREVVPAALTGLDNSRNLYWMALGLLVVVALTCRWLVGTQLGQVWQAIRENPLRVAAMGYHVYGYRLAACVISSTLAGICGMAYAVVMGGASPGILQLEFSIALLLMVVLGGRGLIWGAVVGAALHTYLNFRLPEFAASESVGAWPAWLQVPFSQPGFLMGMVLVVVILFLPGGLASLISGRGRPSRTTSGGGAERARTEEPSPDEEPVRS